MLDGRIDADILDLALEQLLAVGVDGEEHRLLAQAGGTDQADVGFVDGSIDVHFLLEVGGDEEHLGRLAVAQGLAFFDEAIDDNAVDGRDDLGVVGVGGGIDLGQDVALLDFGVMPGVDLGHAARHGRADGHALHRPDRARGIHHGNDLAAGDFGTAEPRRNVRQQEKGRDGENDDRQNQDPFYSRTHGNRLPNEKSDRYDNIAPPSLYRYPRRSPL